MCVPLMLIGRYALHFPVLAEAGASDTNRLIRTNLSKVQNVQRMTNAIPLTKFLRLNLRGA